MFKVITVKIEDRKDVLHFKTKETEIKPNDHVIIKSLIGEELGVVLKSFGNIFNQIKNISCIPEILRRATDSDLDNFRKKTVEEQKAYDFCLKRITEREIPIKLIKVSFFTSERKAIFYFSSEGRIDFRDLVKDLAKKFRMRIEMRQIGIRDEAKMIGGLGICGRQLCCKVFLNSIEPITLQMARRQNLNMNPVKISGQCGRLMCCLSYEEDMGGRIYIEDQDELVGYNEEEEEENAVPSID
ncbi:MAG: regulatory iron-sulfur-containing complex subunit RicT [Candidatus Aminicenantes bacterium]|nr:regulatory iron-sulfur-containing complex subunit RicT [Candidatus Aminicenantes bacterium]